MIRHIIQKSLLVLSIFLGLLSCVKTEISAAYDQNVDFSKYKSFAWLPKKHLKCMDNSLSELYIDQEIIRHINNQMISRGIGLDIQNPTLLLTYTINLPYYDEEIPTPFYRNQFNYLQAQSFLSNGVIIANPSSYKYIKIAAKTGTLTLSMIEKTSQNIVWKGWAESAIVEPTDADMLLPNDVVKMFKNFPIKVKKIIDE